jgi:hypothetical protein
MARTTDAAKMLIRVPPVLKDWVARQAASNWHSMNAEIVAILRAQKAATEAREKVAG